ncbi:2-(3-amino-3-carboxypropyl)histidine synthase subunit 2 [Sphaerodactylus townsendi]|uniref:2-(3-amino-3-carboxypropyl)histidine synthase subunit 2 n=1 Tax=Sphaerodactylus townsendi TaxID=933632 RepID=UPI002025BBAB|nr:2-(3-amino-3-carboxypropyl)histidine synthase subunit 2 [Sphaerodactylus townsendi]XP_048353306.1 2-(3-amino-3-carboxypropyl)histidine synthase subunit 2 [Sphaerodactylus townsendi]XP_048353307.1 2-(3-amino-3-carboxypropyl)histidine synthase subunit 2 [Sphaerodactylus townsendi]XP_048353308.1 2-(3-amino-3-carboxypropyl)histidine synthase subunit 2 [Sphaerodactylus townsendi]
MTTAFSSDGADLIQRIVTPARVGGRPPAMGLEEYYELDRTTAFVLDNNFTKVALQFPDELLSDSATIAAKMEETTGSRMYILGDTSYGSCCVDEVAADHVNAEAVVHYGPACLSPCCKLPVLHVFGRQPLDVTRCVEVFQELHPDLQAHVIVLSDVAYFHAIDSLASQLRPIYPNVVFSEVDSKEALSSAQPDCGLVCQFGRRFTVNEQCGLANYSMFYVGCEGPELTNFMLTWNQCPFSSFNPRTGQGRWETLDVNRTLRRRLYLVERARDAQVVGIVVGTLGVTNYLSVLEHLQGIIQQAGKQAYTLAVGKPSPVKLANFLEVDIFVLVACPQNSLLDSSDYYRPLVTPYEMEMACNPARAWTGRYITDFCCLLPGASEYIPIPDKIADSNREPDISLITGEMRSTCLCTPPEPESTSGTAMICHNHIQTVAQISPAASFLESRSWRGLEQKLGKTAVTKAVPGRQGIAIAYEDESCR